MTAKKEKPTLQESMARVICDTRIGSTLLYVGDVVSAPANLLQHDHLDPHPDAVKYAIENGAAVKKIEGGE